MSTIAYSFETAFAGVALEVTDFADNRGRRLTEYQPSRGSGSEFFDRGQVAWQTSLEAVVLGSAAQAAAGRQTLIALADSGTARTFSHPLDGEWEAHLSSFDSRVANGSVTVSMTLQRVSDFDDAPDNVPDPTENATALDVEVDAQLADLKLEDAAIADVSVAAILAPAQSWSPDTPLADRLDRLNGARAQLADTARTLRTRTDLAAHRALQQMTRAVGQAQRYSDTITSAGIQYAEIVVRGQTSLGALMTSLYGARTVADAVDGTLVERVQARNSLRSVVSLAPGTRLQLPTRQSLAA